MNSFKINLCISLVLFIFFSCDEEINKPVFQTLDVSELSTEGVTLNGRFQVSGGKNISQYGFIWADHNEPQLSDSSYSFPGTPPAGKFQHRVSDGLKNGVTYYVRTFVRADDRTVYSNKISFTALGSATPVIADFYPLSGGSKDTITVTGQHFGENLSSTAVSLGETPCKVLSVTGEKIVFQVPLKYRSGSYPVTLKVAEKTGLSSNKFILEGPVIESISPSTGPAGTVVTLSGTGFSTTPSTNFVYVGGQRASVISATSNQVQITIPVSPAAGDKLVWLELENATTYSPTAFYLSGPVITSFTPTSGTAGTHIVINGSGFSSTPSENHVRLYYGSYANCTVLSATPNQLTVELGSVYYSGNQSQLASSVSVEVKSIVAYSGIEFTIKGPAISSVTPAMQYEGRTVTINGENFDPNGENRVYFSGTLATIINSTATSITVKVPFKTPTLPPQSRISVSVKYYTYDSPLDLNVLTPWKQLADFPGGGRYGVTTFTVGSYSYVATGFQYGVGDKKDLWRFDPSGNSWKRMADLPGSSRAYAFSFVINGKAYVGGGGHYGSINLISNLNDLWEYDPSNDSWSQKSSLPPNSFAGKRFTATGTAQSGYFVCDTYLYRYDPSTDIWSVFGVSTNFSQGGVAATIGDKCYFGLGTGNYTLWMFDPSTYSWSEMANSPLTSSVASGTLSSFTLDNKLYVGSGNMLVTYDPALNEWAQIPNIPAQLYYKGAFAAGDKGYMVTGLNRSGVPNFYSFNPNY